MQSRFAPILVGAAIAGVSWPALAQAQAASYTDASSFTAALPGPSQIVTFDSLSSGTAIPDGGGVAGIAFHYDFGGVRALAIDAFPTTSSPNSVGTDDGSVLQDGDDFQLTFPPQHAIGIYFISADQMLDADIKLSAGGANAELSVGDLQQTLSDGSHVYFLGVIDPTTSFQQPTSRPSAQANSSTASTTSSSRCPKRAEAGSGFRPPRTSGRYRDGGEYR